jgi:hypothetical protein
MWQVKNKAFKSINSTYKSNDIDRKIRPQDYESLESEFGEGEGACVFESRIKVTNSFECKIESNSSKCTWNIK